MKDRVKVSAVQFAPRWLEREHNARRMAEWAEREAAAGAELVVFPELSNVGFITPVMIGQKPSFDEKTSALDFVVKYKKAAEPVPGPTTELLCQVARRWGVYIVVGLARLHPTVSGTLYNAAVLLGPEGLVGVQHKFHIPNNERWYFYPGHGPTVFETALGKIGMTICYDGHFFPEITRALCLEGAEIICEIANVGTRPGWQATGGRFHPFGIDHIACTRALENQCYYIHCNRTGVEGDVNFFGRTALAGPAGQLLAYDASDQEAAVTAELTEEQLLQARSRLAVYRDRRPELYTLLVEPLAKPFSAPPAAGLAPGPGAPSASTGRRPARAGGREKRSAR